MSENIIYQPSESDEYNKLSTAAKPTKKSAIEKFIDGKDAKIKSLQEELRSTKRDSAATLKKREAELLKEINRLHGLIDKYTKRFNEFKRLTSGL